MATRTYGQQRPSPLQATMQHHVAQPEGSQPDSPGLDEFMMHREMNSTQLFAHAAAETQASLHETFAGPPKSANTEASNTRSKPGTANVGRAQVPAAGAGMRDSGGIPPQMPAEPRSPTRGNTSPKRVPATATPAAALESTIGYIEVFPRCGTKQPRLLAQLEQLLSDKLREAERMTGIRGTPTRKAQASANLRLGAHATVFDAFIGALDAYKPLLTAIKVELDGALRNALQCATENLKLRKQLARMEARHEEETSAVRVEVAEQSAPQRADQQVRMRELEERALRAEARSAAATADLASADAEHAKVSKVVEELRATRARMTAAIERESAWEKRAVTGQISTAQIAAITAADVREIDGEVDEDEEDVLSNMDSGPPRESIADDLAGSLSELPTNNPSLADTGIASGMDGDSMDSTAE